MNDIPDIATATSPSGGQYRGGCLCGAVRYQINGEATSPASCHCHMCRRYQGTPGTFVGSQHSAVDITGADNILWFASSPGAERGSCRLCGTKLFWREVNGSGLDINLGSLDRSDYFIVEKHIWVDHRGDYEDLSDDLPKYAQSSMRDGQPVEPLATLVPVSPSSTPLTPPHHGRCLCGSLRFEVADSLQDVVVCHCNQCRHWHGGAGSYTRARSRDLTLQHADALIWYIASPESRRGFCRDCGSCLFWQMLKNGQAAEEISISVGALDAPTGLKTVRQIFLTDRVPSYRQSEAAIRAATDWSSAAPF